MGDREVADGRFASTRQNRAAGRALRAARMAAAPEGATQAEFAARLGDGLGIEISSAALSNWEGGRRSVPSAILIEAATVSGKSTDALLARAGDASAARISPDTSAADVESGGLAEQVAEHRREISELGRLIARMRRRLEKEGIALAEPTEESTEHRADAM